MEGIEEHIQRVFTIQLMRMRCEIFCHLLNFLSASPSHCGSRRSYRWWLKRKISWGLDDVLVFVNVDGDDRLDVDDNVDHVDADDGGTC